MNFLRRGSKKSLVKEIHITSQASIRNERAATDKDTCEFNLHQPEPMMCVTQNDMHTLRELLENTEKELQRLKVKNERLEIARSSLEDKANYFEKMCNEKEAEILSLSTNIEVLKLENNELQSERQSPTYKSKTQCMTSLEEELQNVRDEAKKMVRHLQKKIKRLQENHAKSKQDYALKVFALKDENKKLIEDKDALEDRLHQQTAENSDNGHAETQPNSGPDVDPSFTPRNKLIIQLSQQVTTLDVENQELKEELEKTKRLLQKFELKERGIRTKSRAKHERPQLCVSMANLDLGNSTSKVELHG